MNIEDFKGDAVVIGCVTVGCIKNIHNHPDGVSFDQKFFTVDIRPGADLRHDIRTPLPNEHFKERFSLVLAEGLPFTAYTKNDKLPPGHLFYSLNGDIGFENMLAMARPDGFILIIGSSRTKESRQCVHSRSLKYIELDSGGRCILIPKNQTLTIEVIKERLREADLKPIIERALLSRPTPSKEPPSPISQQDLKFCDSTGSRVAAPHY